VATRTPPPAAAASSSQEHPDGAEGAGARSRPWRPLLVEAAVVLGLSLVAAVALTWPLVLHLGDMAHNADDAAFQAWTIAHVQWALSGGGPLWDANIFHPNPNTLAYSDSLLGLAVPLMPLRWLGLGPIAVLNVALLLSMTTSSAAGYLFGRVVGRRRAVGAVTAAAFAFGPAAAGWAGHLHAIAHGGVALAAVAVWWMADRAERSRSLLAPAVLLCGAVVWQLSVSFYPGIYALMAAGVITAVRWRSFGRRGRRGLGAALAGCAVGGLLLALPYLAVLAEGREFVRAASEVADLGADFTRADSRLWLWGGTVLDRPGSGAPLFPGLALLVLATGGLLLGWRTGRYGRALAAAAGLAALGIFLALGTSDEGWRAWSPYRLLFENVPGVKILRAASRGWVVGLLGAGVLAGFACVEAGRRLAPRRPGRAVNLAAAGAVVLVLLEGMSPWTDKPRVHVEAVDQALAQRPEPGGVVYLPVLLPEGPLALITNFGQARHVLGTTAHHRPTPNGYSGFVPEEFRSFSERMQAFPSRATVEELRALDVRFVVVRSWATGTPWEPLLDPRRGGDQLDLVGRYGRDVLYEVPATP
jgi:hypothetical protein